jgi:pimeloyl-ACP methyl ester carboxylesterase
MVIFESMIQGRVKYRESTIHYSRWGNGGNVVLAIPGFGEGSESFSCIGKLMASDQTLLAVDLPLHGSTDWKENDPMEPSALLVAIRELLFECGFSNTKFSLVGYSMGARIALSIYEEAPERIEQLILLAPDGLNMHFIYWLSTQTYLGSSIFRWTMHHPEFFLKTASLARRADFGRKPIEICKIVSATGSLKEALV